LDISTCGDSFEEAKKNFSELMDAFLSETIKMGTLEEVNISEEKYLDILKQV
jgi:hypothetical protein